MELPFFKKSNKIKLKAEDFSYFNKTNALNGNVPTNGNCRNVLQRYAVFKCAVTLFIHMNL